MLTGTRPKGAGETRSLRVAETLRTKIINNDLAPGSHLLESELVDLLGVSRTPIREALVLLEARGLIEIRPRHGIRVRHLTIEDMEEIYDILIELEPLAAAKAAEAGHPEERFVVVEGCLGRMEAALEVSDRAAWAEADNAFHRELLALSGSRRLVAAVEVFSDQVHRARMITLHMRPEPKDSNTNHRELVDAIRGGCAEEARAIHRAHRIKAKGTIVEALRRHGLSRF